MIRPVDPAIVHFQEQHDAGRKLPPGAKKCSKPGQMAIVALGTQCGATNAVKPKVAMASLTNRDIEIRGKESYLGLKAPISGPRK
jgi:hypothetical protein